MNNLFNKIEKLILSITIICFILLIGVQFINVNDENVINTSQFMKNDKYIPIINKKNTDKGILIIKLLDDEYNEVNILVNGEPAGDFKKDNEIKIKVCENDLVEVDGTAYMDKVKVKLQGISKNVNNPKLDTVITTSQSIEILGKVRLK
ncbi:hypothetical protein [Anaerosalibacter sp. Marseille-P3206]|uniref:hypothetical protein n=1 Tax=Anaerosalibacter sp. Marseille-P3206 TaxID=1871005 RepID=UPI0009845B5D|nr:hypothetical protein [Anaerosalibacter sp. Marseille-P3206]